MPDHYTQLLEWRRAESGARGLAKLAADFYPVTQAYLAELRRTFESELRENPAGKKGDLARQTYQRASQIARDLVESRMTKLLSLSFQTSVGGAREITNALPEERELFDSLVRTLKGHRASVAPYLESTGPAPAAPVPAPTAPVAPAASPPSLVPPPAARVTLEPARVGPALVRVLRDQRPIEAGGETIDLRKEDVLSLPAETARILVEAKIAERIVPAERRPTT
jgi:DNA replication initiation complex subunit (GINS family)